ncbi:hypothetical protein DB347_12075 [Opitutaceae bacterium EW11]|nr:hypothetical protein DB347_12075 [Opitutaceae bacterium EW11]
MRFSPRPVKAVFCAAVVYLSVTRSSRAEGSASYKFQSWQESGDRIRVNSNAAEIDQSLPAEVKLKLSGVIDSISGATPTGEPAGADGQVPLTEMHDKRKAWAAEFSRAFSPMGLSLGLANSRESDYVSNGISLNTTTDFNQKNTTLLLGVATTRDKIHVFYQPEWAKKRASDFIVGVTQLLSPEWSATANLSYGRASGYLSDPYKIIEKDTEVIAGTFLPLTFIENRPGERNKWTLYLGSNRAFTSLDGALDASYRFYHDSFGINSHTLSLAWLQRVGERIVLSPSYRWYTQSAADFYHITLNGTSIVPGDVPNPDGPFFSSDHRLSHMRTQTLGFKVLWKVVPERFDVNFEYQRYLMKGLDGITPKSAYANANVFTVGARLSW